MPAPITIGGEGTLFIGTDKLIQIALKDPAGNALNVTGFSFLFDVRTSLTAPTAVLSKIAIVTATPGVVEIALTDAELGANVFKPKTYKFSLKRMDDGSEDIYAHGDFVIERATQV